MDWEVEAWRGATEEDDVKWEEIQKNWIEIKQNCVRRKRNSNKWSKKNRKGRMMIMNLQQKSRTEDEASRRSINGGSMKMNSN